MSAKQTVIGGLKAGAAVAGANVGILFVLKLAGYDEYPKDPASGEVMQLSSFAPNLIIMSLLACTIGAFVWIKMHRRWEDTVWKGFGALALAIALLYTLFTCGTLSGTPVGGREATIIVGVLHFSTALLGGFWLIPHFSTTGCPCGMCPICNRETSTGE